jgi:hypothetical protein
MKIQTIKHYEQKVVRQFIGKTKSNLDWTVLSNLLADTDSRMVAILYNRHGLKPIPGLSKDGQIQRILANLDDHALKQLQNELVAVRYGDMPTDTLIRIVMEGNHLRQHIRARMDQIALSEATLIDQKGRRWAFTMRGHDVVIDADRRKLACDCEFFAFAHRGGGLCKHLATAVRLIPASYAREVLIELAVQHEYGKERYRWSFESKRAA